MAKVTITFEDTEEDGVQGLDMNLEADPEIDRSTPTLAQAIGVYALDHVTKIAKRFGASVGVETNGPRR
jgi:hypothetical protein